MPRERNGSSGSRGSEPPPDPNPAGGAELAVSAFFPAHDEAENVDRLLENATRVLEDLADDHEIVVVDDGSTDGTAEKVLRWADRDPRIRLVRHERNKGYGGALISGFRACRHDWVFFSDADNQFDLRELEKLLELRREADLIIGYRQRRQDHLLRKLNAEGWRLLVRWVLGLDVRDVDCAFKLIRRRVLEDLELSAQGAVISAELLVQAKRAGYRIREIGVHHLPRTAGRSSGARPRVILRAFRELLILRRRLGRAPR